MSHECYMNVTFRFCFRSPLKSLKLPVFKGLFTDLGSHSFLHISFYPLYIRSKHYHATFEPLFEDVGEIDLEGYEWIVIGTETGKRKGKVDANPEWVLHIVEQAKRNHIPVFMKEDLLPIMGEDRMIQELPEQFIEKIWKRK